MDHRDEKSALHRYLQVARDALWKRDGLSEYDVRRPLVPTGTNPLGLVKHLAGVEAGYFGEVFDRPFPNLSRGWAWTLSRTPTCGRPWRRFARTSCGELIDGAVGLRATADNMHRRRRLVVGPPPTTRVGPADGAGREA